MLGSVVVRVNRPKVVVLVSESVVAVLCRSRSISLSRDFIEGGRAHKEVVESDFPRSETKRIIPVESEERLSILVVAQAESDSCSDEHESYRAIVSVRL